MTGPTQSLHQIGLVVIRMMILSLFAATTLTRAFLTRPTNLLHQCSLPDTTFVAFFD